MPDASLSLNPLGTAPWCHRQLSSQQIRGLFPPFPEGSRCLPDLSLSRVGGRGWRGHKPTRVQSLAKRDSFLGFFFFGCCRIGPSVHYYIAGLVFFIQKKEIIKAGQTFKRPWARPGAVLPFAPWQFPKITELSPKIHKDHRVQVLKPQLFPKRSAPEAGAHPLHLPTALLPAQVSSPCFFPSPQITQGSTGDPVYPPSHSSMPQTRLLVWHHCRASLPRPSAPFQLLTMGLRAGPGLCVSC